MASMSRPPFFRGKKHSHKSRSQPGHRPHSSSHAQPHASSGSQTFIEGILQVKKTFGFVLAPDGSGDVLIQGRSFRLAMDGDRVRARVTGVNEGRRFGEIVEV